MFRKAVPASAFCVAAAMLGGTPTAEAQIATVTPEIARKIAAFGQVINPDDVGALYAPLQEREPYGGVTVARDVKYGPADRNLLDIIAGDSGGGARPVLIFVHGGAFTRGDKRTAGRPFYDNISLWAARNGLVGVQMTYRLAPQNPWPAGAEDIASAVRWVGENIAAHGGDPARIFLMGHSAGAVHVGSYVAHAQFHGARGSGLAGAILLSGLFDLTSMRPGPPEKSYFGEDAGKYAERSSLAGLLRTRTPLMLAYAELDPAFFEQQAQQLNAALCGDGKCPRLIKLAGHSHMSEVFSINTKDVELTSHILTFIRSVP